MLTCWNWGDCKVERNCSWLFPSISGKCSLSWVNVSVLFIISDKASVFKAVDKSTGCLSKLRSSIKAGFSVSARELDESLSRVGVDSVAADSASSVTAAAADEECPCLVELREYPPPPLLGLL